MEGLEFTIKLSAQMIDAIADKVLEKSKKLQTYPSEDEVNYTVHEVAKLTNKGYRTILKHIEADLLIANKIGKSHTITHQNYINYINGK